MAFVVAKIALTPLLLAICTFVAHHWGESVGGWLLGLPLTSGPVSVFLFAEHGATFAEKAALATLLGVVAGAVFCACYAFASTRMRWWQTLATSYAACLATVWALSLAHFSLAGSLVLVIAALALVAIVMTRTSESPPGANVADCGEAEPHVGSSEWRGPRGLLGRMAVAAASVVAITAIAGLFGPRVGGMLAPLPVLVAVMATSSHRRGARGEARGLLRGAVVGSWGGVAFFTVVAVMLATSGPLATYGAATAAALTAAAVAMATSGGSVGTNESWADAEASGFEPSSVRYSDLSRGCSGVATRLV